MFLHSPHNVKLLYGSYFLFLPGDSFQNIVKYPAVEDTPEIFSVPDPQIIETPKEEKKDYPVSKTLRPINQEMDSSEVSKNIENKPPKNPFQGETKITWKSKANTKFFVIVSEAAFTNRMLMIALREFIIESGIPVGYINFGVYPTGAIEWDISDMTLPLGVLFAPSLGFTKEPQRLGTKLIYSAPDLLQLIEKTELQKILTEILKEIKPIF